MGDWNWLVVLTVVLAVIICPTSSITLPVNNLKALTGLVPQQVTFGDLIALPFMVDPFLEQNQHSTCQCAPTVVLTVVLAVIICPTSSITLPVNNLKALTGLVELHYYYFQ
jgi:hypothetical protein